MVAVSVWTVGGGVSVLAGLFVWCLCMAAGDSDRALERMFEEDHAGRKRVGK